MKLSVDGFALFLFPSREKGAEVKAAAVSLDSVRLRPQPGFLASARNDRRGAVALARNDKAAYRVLRRVSSGSVGLKSSQDSSLRSE